MSNGNIKTQMKRVPTEWIDLINKIIIQIEENGYPEKIMPPEIIRLLIHYKPARDNLNKAISSIVQGFQGVKKINPEVERYMKGVVNHE